MTKYRVSYKIGGKWIEDRTFDSMTEAELMIFEREALMVQYESRVEVIEEAK